MSAFAIYRSPEGALTLRHHCRILPVNPTYLEQMLVDRNVTVEPEWLRLVDASWAKDAIEEALGYLDHQITMGKIDRKRLLSSLGNVLKILGSSEGNPLETSRGFTFAEAA